MNQQFGSDPFEILRFKRACMLQIHVKVENTHREHGAQHKLSSNGVEGVGEMHVGYLEDDGGAENTLSVWLQERDCSSSWDNLDFYKE